MCVVISYYISQDQWCLCFHEKGSSDQTSDGKKRHVMINMGGDENVAIIPCSPGLTLFEFVHTVEQGIL